MNIVENVIIATSPYLHWKIEGTIAKGFPRMEYRPIQGNEIYFRIPWMPLDSGYNSQPSYLELWRLRVSTETGKPGK